MQFSKKQWKPQLNLILTGILFCLMSPGAVKAQIISDETLPNNSVVNLEGEVQQITGGSQLGSNLFHSFKDFSVPTGSTAYFNNTLDIQNIISRVTGKSVSNIDGLIKNNGTANLFLLNPNGIGFGSNASLNIGGSFVASTASSLNFADGTQFNATSFQKTPLLTVSVPIGLQFNTNPEVIRLQGNGYNNIASIRGYPRIIRANSSPGLQVKPGKTLALVGGDVALEGGVLTAEGGRIELGSVGSGQVSLITTNSGWSLGYDNVPAFKDIWLSQQALVNVSGSSSGSVHLQGSRVQLTDGSLIWSQNQGSLPSGNLTVNAANSLELIGRSFDGEISSGLASEAVGNGNGGDIEISTNELAAKDGAEIATVTYSTGKGGSLKVNASNSIEILGFSPLNFSIATSGMGTLTYGSGSGGDFRISTRTFNITNGGFFITNTYGSGFGGNFTISTESLTITNGGTVGSLTFGRGTGGDVTVNANNSVEVVGAGVAPNVSTPSVLNAGTFSSGDAGSLTINTPKLLIRDGGRVNTSTSTSGNAGSLTINASDYVEVSGTVPDSVNLSLLDSSAIVLDESLQQLLELPPEPSGASGKLTISTRQLRVKDGGQVSVRNDGSGDAGKLQINAESIFLDDRGSITATTASGQGGDILLQTQNLQLRHNSPITATAFGGSGSGGNITIDTDTLVALENSDITANAFGGPGGNVRINAQGIFGTQFREQLTPESSDITASSEFGVSGVVEVNNPDTDPSRGLITLPTEPVNLTGLIAQGCPAGSGPRASKFVITGRGGLPDNPSETLNSDTIWTDLRPTFHPAEERPSEPPVSTQPTNPTAMPLVEANGWIINSKGEVVLTATAPSATLQVPWIHPSGCHAS